FRPEVTFGSNTLVSAGDFDIFLVKHDRFGNVAWAKRAGGAGSDFSFGIAVDAMTNVYLTGFFTDLATFDSTNLVSSGGQDIFVAKYSSGALDWVRQAGGATDSDFGYGIAVDAVGNAYVSGTFQGVASFGTNTLSGFGEEDIFVAKFDPSGNVLWARQAGGGALDQGYGIALDGENNCYVTGRFTDT